MAYLRARPERVWEGGANELGLILKHRRKPHTNKGPRTQISSLDNAGSSVSGADVIEQ